MTNNSDLFLDAFGGESEKEASLGQPQGPDTRGKLFQSAFGQESKKELPQPHLGQSWRLNMTKVASLSFTEQYQLAEHQDTPYRDLPAWVRDGGFAIASQDETKHQKKTFSETGLSQTERNQVFNAALADAEAVAAMVKSDILRDSAVLDGEIASLHSRYGSELLNLVSEVDAEAASYINARIKTKKAEKLAEQRAANQAENEEQVRADIKAAQEAIAAMGNGNPLVADSVQRGSEVN